MWAYVVGVCVWIFAVMFAASCRSNQRCWFGEKSPEAYLLGLIDPSRASKSQIDTWHRAAGVEAR